jgi:dynein heavy chain 2, cytosolic
VVVEGGGGGGGVFRRSNPVRLPTRQVIQAAIKERKPRVSVLSVDVDVNFNAGVFVTLNPAGKGYGGRSKLPDNLKQLFRPVAMTKPDNDLIGEVSRHGGAPCRPCPHCPPPSPARAVAQVILYSEGFTAAQELGHKVVALFTLASQLLSTQVHYDWGLRSLKTVLNTGGSIIQGLKRSGVAVSPESEKQLLIKAIRVNTLSKLTFEDGQRFVKLLGDIFPGVPSEDIAHAELEAAIKEVMTNKPFNLEFDPGQVRKMLQLKEALDQRIGCLVVGPSGCGKSTLWRVLQAALVKCGQSIVTHVMNPKSMPRSRLLGEMDHDTREWTDGVLTAAARQVRPRDSAAHAAPSSRHTTPPPPLSVPRAHPAGGQGAAHGAVVDRVRR